MRIQGLNTAIAAVFLVFLSGCAALDSTKSEGPVSEQLRKEGIRGNKDAVCMERGRYLLAIRNYEEALVGEQEGNFFAGRRYRAFCNEVKKVSNQLYSIGRRAFEEKRYDFALEALTVSNSLSPDPAAKELVLKIWRQRQEKLREVRNVETAKAEDQWPELKAEFRRFMKAEDLGGAQKIVAKMQKLDSKKAAPFSMQIHQRIEWEVRSEVSRGQMLYAQGYLQEAITVWQKALELKPDDPELVQNITRAQKFLENMDKWGK